MTIETIKIANLPKKRAKGSPLNNNKIIISNESMFTG